jgi:hypothetical protein
MEVLIVINGLDRIFSSKVHVSDLARFGGYTD